MKYLAYLCVCLLFLCGCVTKYQDGTTIRYGDRVIIREEFLDGEHGVIIGRGMDTYRVKLDNPIGTKVYAPLVNPTDLEREQ